MAFAIPILASMAAAATAAGTSHLLGGRERREQHRSSRSQRKYMKEEKRRYKKENRLFKKQLKKYGGEKFKQYPSLNKQQQGLLDYINRYGKGETGLQGLLQETPLYQAGQRELLDMLSQSPEAYERFKAPVMREFREEITPEIANRFAGAGALRSSGFQNALGHAGASLGEKLGALRAGLRETALGQALQYAQAPIQNQLSAAQLGLGTDPFVNIYRPPTIPGYPTPATAFTGGQRSPGFLGSFASGFAPALGKGLGSNLSEGIMKNIFSGSQSRPSSSPTKLYNINSLNQSLPGYT